MMTPDELVAYMEQVAEQCPDDLLEGDVYTMVHFGIELGKLAELEKMADMLFRIHQKIEKMVSFVESVERRGGFKR